MSDQSSQRLASPARSIVVAGSPRHRPPWWNRRVLALGGPHPQRDHEAIFEASQPGEVAAEERAHLPRHRVEQLGRRQVLRDERGDAPQRGLLVGQPLDLRPRLGVGDRGCDQVAEARCGPRSRRSGSRQPRRHAPPRAATDEDREASDGRIPCSPSRRASPPPRSSCRLGRVALLARRTETQSRHRHAGAMQPYPGRCRRPRPRSRCRRGRPARAPTPRRPVPARPLRPHPRRPPPAPTPWRRASPLVAVPPAPRRGRSPCAQLGVGDRGRHQLRELVEPPVGPPRASVAGDPSDRPPRRPSTRIGLPSAERTPAVRKRAGYSRGRGSAVSNRRGRSVWRTSWTSVAGVGPNALAGYVGPSGVSRHRRRGVGLELDDRAGVSAKERATSAATPGRPTPVGSRPRPAWRLGEGRPARRPAA